MTYLTLKSAYRDSKNVMPSSHPTFVAFDNSDKPTSTQSRKFTMLEGCYAWQELGYTVVQTNNRSYNDVKSEMLLHL